MPNCWPASANAAGASVAEEYVWYRAPTGGLVVTVSLSEICCGITRSHRSVAVAVTVSDLNSVAGGGATTWKVVCTLWPAPTEENAAADVAVTVHPAGADRLSWTWRTGSAPLSVNVSGAVAGWPPVSAVRPVRAMVVLGGVRNGNRSGLIRSRATPCGATFAAIVPPASVAVCFHRSFRKYALLAGRPSAEAVAPTTSGLVEVLKSPTTTSPFFSVLANTCAVGVLTIRDASIASWSTERTALFFRYVRSVGSRLVRSVPRISGDAASAHKLIWVGRSAGVRPSLLPLPTSRES